MNFTIFLLGREVLSLSLELPAIPVVSELGSMFVPAVEEAIEAADDEWEEEGSIRPLKIGFQQCSPTS